MSNLVANVVLALVPALLAAGSIGTIVDSPKAAAPVPVSTILIARIA